MSGRSTFPPRMGNLLYLRSAEHDPTSTPCWTKAAHSLPDFDTRVLRLWQRGTKERLSARKQRRGMLDQDGDSVPGGHIRSLKPFEQASRSYEYKQRCTKTFEERLFEAKVSPKISGCRNKLGRQAHVVSLRAPLYSCEISTSRAQYVAECGHEGRWRALRSIAIG